MSRKLEKKNADVPKHRHCPVCGGPMEMESGFCSLECENEYEKRMKKGKRSQMLTMLLLVGIIVLFTVIPILSRLLFPSA